MARICRNTATYRFLILFVATTHCTLSVAAENKTITLKRQTSYTVPANEIWKIKKIIVENGPSTDIEFKGARVYFGDSNNKSADQFLISGDFGISVFSRYNLSLYIQPESQVIIGQRRDIKADILKFEPESSR